MSFNAKDKKKAEDKREKTEAELIAAANSAAVADPKKKEEGGRIAKKPGRKPQEPKLVRSHRTVICVTEEEHDDLLALASFYDTTMSTMVQEQISKFIRDHRKELDMQRQIEAMKNGEA